MNQPQNELLQNLILLVRYFADSDGKLRLSGAKLKEYIAEFGTDNVGILSTIDPETGDVTLTLDRQQAPTPPTPAGE